MADSDGGSSWSAVESLLGDRYTREARLAPAFLSVFPILLVLLLSFKGLQSAIPALLTLLCVFGVVRWISHIARGIGDKKEIKLFRDWGGKPTTTMMRVALGYLSDRDAAVYGEQVAHLLGEAPPRSEIFYELEQRKGVLPPTRDQDRIAAQTSAKTSEPPPNEPGTAAPPPGPNPPAPIAVHVAAKDIGRATSISDALDRLYEPSVAWMRENSRNSVLVVEEEISYGFQRNFFALRGFASLAAVGSFLVEARAAHLQPHLAWPLITVDSAIAAVILSALAVYMLGLAAFVTEKSVMVQGFIYARALLDSFYADNPSTKPPAKPVPADPS